jgi:CHAT domain-containing protein/Tfp pilus assembly protein PilF
MKRIAPLLLLLVSLAPAAGQDFPRPAATETAALDAWIERMVAAGGLIRPNGASATGPALVPGDPARLRAALAADPAARSPARRDALIARWAAPGRDEGLAIAAVLEAIGRQAGDDRALAFAVVFRAKAETGRGDYAEAFRDYEQARARFVALGDRPWEALCEHNVGSNYNELGRYREALDHLNKALAIRRAVGGEGCLEVAQTEHNIGFTFSHLGRFPEAIRAHEHALKIRRTLYGEEHESVANALSNLGTIYEQIGRLDQALELDRQALDIARKAHGEDHPDVALALNNLGSVATALGRFEEALGYHRRSLAISRKLAGDDSPAVAISLNNIGTLLYQTGRYGEALDAFRQALDARRKAFGGRHPSVGESLSNLAFIYEVQGEYRRALDYMLQALDVDRSNHPGDHPDVALDLNNIGSVYARMEDYDRALDYLRQALRMRIATLGPDHAAVAATHNNIGFVHARRGELAAAAAAYELALGIKRKAYREDNLDIALSLNNLAALYGDQGDRGRELDRDRQALAIRRRLLGENHPEVAASWQNLGLCLSNLNRHAEARAALDAAVRALRLSPDPGPGPMAIERLTPGDLRALPQTIAALRARGSVLEGGFAAPPAADQLRDCARNYALALAVLSEVRARVAETTESKILLGDSPFEVVPRYLATWRRLAATAGPPAGLPSPYAVAEEGTARVFLEALGRSRALDLGGIPAALRTAEADQARRLRALERALDEELGQPLERRSPRRIGQAQAALRGALAESAALIARLGSEYPQYAALMYPRPCPIVEARACLDRDEVALLFVLGEMSSFLVVVPREGGDRTDNLEVHELPPAGQLRERIAALTRPAVLGDADRARELAAGMFAALLGAASRSIRGKDLVIVPGGALGQLPFELLVEPAADPAGPGEGHFLVERHRVRYAPSLTALWLIRRWEGARPEPSRPFWALGDPIYRGSDDRLATRPEPPEAVRSAAARLPNSPAGFPFERLPGAGVEIARIGSLLGAARDELLVGQAAQESAVKALSASGALGRYRYIHFATHGLLGLADGTQPALVLSLVGEQHGEDGLLHLDEVTTLRLNADLVVLSACQTGRGRLSNAEGISGLARAFLYAGSRGVACSLWLVNDATTAELMADFYDALKAGTPAAEALRRAKLRAIADGEPPLNWAPFVLIGR